MTIYVDGFERSGNTFLGEAMGWTIETNVITLRSHKISNIQDKLPEDIFVVPVRDALPTLVSAKVYRDYVVANNLQVAPRTGDPTELIERLTAYIDYLLTNEEVFIAPFDNIIADHNAVLDVFVAKYPDYSIAKRYTEDEIIAKNEFTQEEKENSYTGNFPRTPAAAEKANAQSIFLNTYATQIQSLQNKINTLYQRYANYNQI
jgi:hypothetical protein